MITSIFEKKILSEAKQHKRKIAVGICRPDDKEIKSSLKKAAAYADITIVGSTIKGFECIPTKDDDEASHVIVQLVKDKKVDGFVRAQLKDSYTHQVFIEVMGNGIDAKQKNTPCFFGKDNFYCALSNPSNYHSIDATQQKLEAERTAKFFRDDLGIEPKIAVMSTRRPSGRVGEFPALEQIAANCEETARYLRTLGYDVKEYYIEYERAVWEKRNLFVAATGMIANTWFKGLIYLGGWHMIAGPYLDQGAYYDDSPRIIPTGFGLLLTR